MDAKRIDAMLLALQMVRQDADKLEAALVDLKGLFEADRALFVCPVIGAGESGTTGEKLATPEQISRFVNQAREGYLVQLVLYADRGRAGAVVCRLQSQNQDGTLNCVLWGDPEAGRTFVVKNPPKDIWWWTVYRIIEAV